VHDRVRGSIVGDWGGWGHDDKHDDHKWGWVWGGWGHDDHKWGWGWGGWRHDDHKWGGHGKGGW
jgi:hypothetical protein